MSTQKQHPGRLGLASVFLRTILSVSVRLITSPFKGSRGAPTYYKDVLLAGFRTQLRNLSLEQAAYMNSTTEAGYQEACKTLGITPDSVTLPSGIKAHWVGKRNAEKLLVYYHGGGYNLPATAGHFVYLADLKNSLISAGHDTSVVLLGYTLTPEGVYPKQLKEAVEFLRYLLDLKQWGPSKITLAGDSAGGNLTLGVLSHILHPHPQIAPLTLSEPLNAAILISPWVSFKNNEPSFQRNAERDLFDRHPLDRWSKAFLGGATSGDNYSEPGLAPSSWWEGMDKIVSEVLIWGGDWEVLVDSIREFAATFKKGYGANCHSMYGEKGMHEDMIVEKLLGYKTKSHSTLDLENWVKAKL